jgi:gliding motility-associated lipoprotein GldH
VQKVFVFFVFLMLMLSCQRGPWMEARHDFPNANWIRFETQWFDFTPPEQEVETDIRLFLTYNENIELDRLPVMGSIHTPSGEMRYRELMFHLKDEAGNMKGTVQSSEGKTIWQQEVMMRQQFVFREEGVYRFEIENLSSKYDNPGILSLEIRVEAR